MRKPLTIDFILKVFLICSIGYFTFHTTEYLKKRSEIGRYQLSNEDPRIVIDTKTGIVYAEEELEINPRKNR